MAYYIGIDIGSSSVKGAVINDSGEIIKTTSCRVDTFYPYPGYSEQNPYNWWDAFKKVVRLLIIGIPGKISSLAISGQMHTLVILDEYNKPIRPAILWSDQRSIKECDSIFKEWGGEKKFIASFGNSLFPGFTASMIKWLKTNEPDNFRRIDKILLPKDFINFQLTGKHTSDLSDLSGTCLLDIKNNEYNTEILEILGISSKLLPEILISGQYIGQCKNLKISKLNDVPIIMGGADNACALLGNGVEASGQGLLSLGTSGTIVGIPRKPKISSSGVIHLFHRASNNGYYQMAVLLSAASSLDWLKKLINPRLSYQEIMQRISKVPPGSEGVIFLPHLNGDRFPGKNYHSRGVFFGLNPMHSQNILFRSVLEGVIFVLKDGADRMKEIGTEINDLIITGGGAQNDVWCQIAADIFQKQVKRFDKNIGPDMGAALIAKHYIDEKPFEINCRSKEFLPNLEFGRTYIDCYNRYKSLYFNLQTEFEKIPI